MAKLSSRGAYLKLYTIRTPPPPSKQHEMAGGKKPVPWRKAGCGFLTRTVDDVISVKDPESGLTATGDSIPEAIGNLRDQLRDYRKPFWNR